jgi:hypothetical protein
MRTLMRRAAIPAALIVLFCSCSKEEGFRKETFPVKGEVYVDGSPAPQLQVTCHDVKGMDKEHPTFSSAFTNEEGKFEISTYESADGVPEGEYVLTFMWGQMNMISMSYGGPDKLNGRYRDPKAADAKRVTVTKGTPADLGRIELTTK